MRVINTLHTALAAALLLALAAPVPAAPACALVVPSSVPVCPVTGGAWPTLCVPLTMAGATNPCRGNWASGSLFPNDRGDWPTSLGCYADCCGNYPSVVSGVVTYWASCAITCAGASNVYCHTNDSTASSTPTNTAVAVASSSSSRTASSTISATGSSTATPTGTSSGSGSSSATVTSSSSSSGAATAAPATSTPSPSTISASSSGTGAPGISASSAASGSTSPTGSSTVNTVASATATMTASLFSATASGSGSSSGTPSSIPSASTSSVASAAVQSASVSASRTASMTISTSASPVVTFSSSMVASASVARSSSPSRAAAASASPSSSPGTMYVAVSFAFTGVSAASVLQLETGVALRRGLAIVANVSLDRIFISQLTDTRSGAIITASASAALMDINLWRDGNPLRMLAAHVLQDARELQASTSLSIAATITLPADGAANATSTTAQALISTVASALNASSPTAKTQLASSFAAFITAVLGTDTAPSAEQLNQLGMYYIASSTTSSRDTAATPLPQAANTSLPDSMIVGIAMGSLFGVLMAGVAAYYGLRHARWARIAVELEGQQRRAKPAFEHAAAARYSASAGKTATPDAPARRRTIDPRVAAAALKLHAAPRAVDEVKSGGGTSMIYGTLATTEDPGTVDAHVTSGSAATTTATSRLMSMPAVRGSLTDDPSRPAAGRQHRSSSQPHGHTRASTSVTSHAEHRRSSDTAVTVPRLSLVLPAELPHAVLSHDTSRSATQQHIVVSP